MRASVVLALLLTTAAVAENGKILETHKVGNPRLPAGVELRRIVYESDGLKVGGYVAVPPGEGKAPCLILNRGGNANFSTWNGDRATRGIAKIASWGYVVAASQYRGAAGVSEGKDEFGGADVNDVLNLIPLLEAEPRCDAKRIGMIGWSRGGMMTYLAMTRTDRIAGAVVVSGMADAAADLKSRPEMVHVYSATIPNFEQNRAEALAQRSAITFADKLHKKTPVLLLHGTADWRTPPATNALAMANALLAAKHPFRLMLYEGGDHGVTEHREDVDRAMREWLDRYVRDGKSWPSLEPHGD